MSGCEYPRVVGLHVRFPSGDPVLLPVGMPFLAPSANVKCMQLLLLCQFHPQQRNNKMVIASCSSPDLAISPDVRRIRSAHQASRADRITPTKTASPTTLEAALREAVSPSTLVPRGHAALFPDDASLITSPQRPQTAPYASVRYLQPSRHNRQSTAILLTSTPRPGLDVASTKAALMPLTGRPPQRDGGAGIASLARPVDLLEASGERWLMRSLLARERMTTTRHFVQSHRRQDARREATCRLAQEQCASAHERLHQLERSSSSAETNARLLRELEAARAEADELRSRTTSLESVVATQRQQLSEAGRDRLSANWLSHIQQHITEKQIGEMHSELGAVHGQLESERQRVFDSAVELDKARRQYAMHKRSSVKALENLHKVEREQIAKVQEVRVQHCAATLVQAHCRRRRAAAEGEALRAKERLANVEHLASMQMQAARTAMDLDHKIGAYRAAAMTLICDDGVERSIKEALGLMVNSRLALEEREKQAAAAHAGASGTGASGAVEASKYVRELVLGRPEAAALGIVSSLHIDLFDLFAVCTRGLDAIREEWELRGSDQDVECVRYVLDEPAGSSDKCFVNGVRDVGRNGERLADFVAMHDACTAQLTSAHVASVRIYTTACFRSLNDPLRDTASKETHPFPATIFFLTDAIKRLRAVHAEHAESAASQRRDAGGGGGGGGGGGNGGGRGSGSGGGGDECMHLWRGMKNVSTSNDFERTGGSEMAPMSTTSDPAVAVAYGQSTRSLLFKIVSKSFMTRGADITFLSAFPGEREYLFPPLVWMYWSRTLGVLQSNLCCPPCPSLPRIAMRVDTLTLRCPFQTFLQPTGKKEIVKVELLDAQGSKTGAEVEFRVVEVEPVM